MIVTYLRSKSNKTSSTSKESTQTSNLFVNNSPELNLSTTTSPKKTMSLLSDLSDSTGDSSQENENLWTLREMLLGQQAPRKRKRSFEKMHLTSSSSTETKSNETSPKSSSPSVARSVPGLYHPSIIQAASTTGTTSMFRNHVQNGPSLLSSSADQDSARLNSPVHSVLTFMCKECGASMTLWGGIGTGMWYGTTFNGTHSRTPTSSGWEHNPTSG